MAATRIPLFPLGLVLLPDMLLPLHIFEERYKLMIGECLSADQAFGIVWFDGQAIRSVGCTARVVEVLHRYEDGRMDILTRGGRRFFTESIVEEKPYMEADVLFIEDEAGQPEAEAVAGARDLLHRLHDDGYLEMEVDAAVFSEPRRLSFLIPAIEGFTHAERQRFLEMTSAGERLRKGVEALARILERLQVTRQIQAIIGGNGHPPREALLRLAAADATPKS